VVQNAKGVERGGIVDFISFNGKQSSSEDWQILSKVSFLPSETTLAGHVAMCASELLEGGLRPESDSLVHCNIDIGHGCG